MGKRMEFFLRNDEIDAYLAFQTKTKYQKDLA
jgi:hypothetical protein